MKDQDTIYKDVEANDDLGGEPEAISVERYEELDEPPPASRRKAILIVLAVVLIAGGLLGYWLWRRSHAAPAVDAEAEPNVTVSVKVAKAERKTIGEPVSALGTVSARSQSTISAKISAQIRQMALLKNQFVRAGDVIATLESRDLHAQRGEAAAAVTEAEANVASVTKGAIPQANAQDEKALRDARANVANARATFERRTILFGQGAISKKDLEASQLALITAENDLRLAERTATLRANAISPSDRAVALAHLQQAQQHVGTIDAQLGYAVIRAPITGIITDQFQFQGDFLAAGAKLVTIADVSEVIVKAPFADTVAAQLKVGDPAAVAPTDSPGEPMNGKISLVSRSSDPLNRAVEVWVNLANGAGRLRANGAAQVTVTTKLTKDAVVVPAAAVTLDASNANSGTVMVVDAQSVAKETKVKVGIRTTTEMQITSGLEGGETVVVEGNYALPDGTKVEPTEEKDTGGDNGDTADEGGADDKKGEQP